MSTVLIEPVFISSLQTAVQSIFDVQLGEKFLVSQPTPILNDESNYDIAAVITMLGPKAQGLLILGFPKASFLNVVNTMLGETFTAIDSENADAAGELLNMTYGAARRVINENTQHAFNPAIPSVVRGDNIKISHSGMSEKIRMSIQSSKGEFTLELSMKRVGG